MYLPEIRIKNHQHIGFLEFKRFELEDREWFEKYAEQFKPISCEYNFANLFAWQDVCQFSWTIYQDRILIHNGVSKSCFMPFGEEMIPQELAFLSMQMMQAGFSPNISLCFPDYLEKYPQIEKYYQIQAKRDVAEYIYDVNHLAQLTGVKLHKKRNLISQFKRSYPDFQIHAMNKEYQSQAFDLANALMQQVEKPSKTLKQEFLAIQNSFEHFYALGLEGLVLTIEQKVIAFSVFSRLNPSCFDIQFEKSDSMYKGAAQVINQETAMYLKDKCQTLNREQDIGIQGLRQAKLSYEPSELTLPHLLVFNPVQ
ncbi:MAG: phosphatidylglycerol lysyltransferase domain-containing protein [Pseudomonadota bacterium]